jgi:hypothetical protein
MADNLHHKKSSLIVATKISTDGSSSAIAVGIG